VTGRVVDACTAGPAAAAGTSVLAPPAGSAGLSIDLAELSRPAGSETGATEIVSTAGFRRLRHLLDDGAEVLVDQFVEPFPMTYPGRPLARTPVGF
jgi:hypothetical protein